MNEITITLTLKEAESICRALAMVDPCGVFAGDVLKRIDIEARKALEKVTKDKKVAP